MNPRFSTEIRKTVTDSVSSRVWIILKKAASRKWSGFTLAELIVVVTVLAILATVGFLALSGYSDDAKDAASKSNVRSVLSAIRSESALTGNSPRRYIVHDASLSWVALSGAFVEFSNVRTYLTWGNWNVPDTNYSAGNPDWAVLKLDASKFKIADVPRFPFVDGARAAYDPKSVLLWASDSLERSWTRTRSVSMLQGAAILPSGTAYVTGDVPAFSSASGASLSLIRDPAQGSSTGALVDEASVSVPASVTPSSTPYALANSIRFDSSRSPSLTRTYSVSGSWTGQKFTMSKWIKRGKLWTQQNLLFVDSGTAWWSTGLEFTAGDQLRLYTYYGLSTTRYGWYTTQVFRDPGAWMHVVLSVDTSQPVAADREKLYVNGVRVTSFSPEASGYAIQNMQTYVMNSAAGAHSIASSSPFDGYLSDVNWVDGQALDASSFGENDPVSGSWKPKQYAGTYGVNGFRLDFSSGATVAWLGLDASPIAATGHVASNNWTPTAGIAVTDQVADTPLNNFSTLNPLVNKSLAWAGVWNGSVANGNLAISSNGASNFNSYGTQLIWPNSGKVYWEVKNSVGGTSGYYPISGLAPESNLTSSYYWWLSNGEGGFAQYADGNVLVLWTSVFSTTAPGATWTIGYAFDPSNGKYWISINGVWQNSWNPSGGTGNVGTLPTWVNYVPAFSMAWAGSSVVANFGQWGMTGLTYSASAGGFFKYAPPDWFKALSTANAPSVAVANARSAFDVLTWTGDGVDNRDISGLSFSPDLLWFKARSNANYPALFDSVRGAGKGMYSNSAQGDTDWSSIMKSFNSDGFKAWTDSSVNSAWQTYVAWNWKAGWTPVSNSAWTISSSVSANPTAGISIVSYTWTSANATIGHGLSSIPKMVLYKARSWSTGWATYFSSIGPTYQVWLNSASAKYTPADFNSTNPTATTLAVGPQNEVNQSTVGYVAYAFSEVPGFSKFGTYSGNGSTDGSFVNLWFRPKFVLIKIVSWTSDNWQMLDSVRSAENPVDEKLESNSANQEATNNANRVDFLSNWFKVRGSDNGSNASGSAYLYAAFAEAPFWGAGIAPATAK